MSFKKSIYNKFFIPFHLSIMSIFTVFASSTSPISVPKPSSNQPKIATHRTFPHPLCTYQPMFVSPQIKLPISTAPPGCIKFRSSSLDNAAKSSAPETRTDSPPVAADSRHCKVQNLVCDRAGGMFGWWLKHPSVKNMRVKLDQIPK